MMIPDSDLFIRFEVCIGLLTCPCPENASRSLETTRGTLVAGSSRAAFGSAKKYLVVEARTPTIFLSLTRSRVHRVNSVPPYPITSHFKIYTNLILSLCLTSFTHSNFQSHLHLGPTSSTIIIIIITPPSSSSTSCHLLNFSLQNLIYFKRIVCLKTYIIAHMV